MSIPELIASIPVLLNMFVPGFIFFKLFNYFVDSKDENYDITIVSSIVLSYVFYSISLLVIDLFNIPTNLTTIFSIILSVLSSLIAVKIRRTAVIKKATVMIGKTTGNKSIWYDFFDLNKGTRVRFFTRYNNQDVCIQADIKYFEVCDDGECTFVISNFIVEYENNNVYEDKNATMIFNTKNIHGLEATYGK